VNALLSPERTADLRTVARFATGGAPPDDEAQLARLLDAVDAHRVAPLAAFWQQRRPHLDLAPGPVRTRLSARLRDAVARELVQRRELARVAAALQDAGVTAVAIKGAALAYSVYPDPALRPRIDTDLLVEERELPRLVETLGRLGYHRDVEPDSRLATYQCHFERPEPGAGGFVHRCDVHWRIANVQRFAAAVLAGEVCEASRAVAGVEPLRAPSTDLSLLLACIHRTAHHFGADTLIWLYDIHALAGALTAEDWRRLLTLAERRGMDGVLADGVLRAVDLFATPVPSAVLDALRGANDPRSRIRETRRLIDVLDDDLRVLPTWGERLQLLREHLLPSSDYMRVRYGVAHRAALPALYAYRILRGAPRWFRPNRPH
jgi:putative nucleotidyltransferase-like protein